MWSRHGPAVLALLVLAAGVTAAARFGGERTSRAEHDLRRAFEQIDPRAPGPRAEAAVHRYVRESGGTVEARWLGAEVLLRLGRVEPAARMVWTSADARSSPGAARRLARLYLEARVESESRDVRPWIALAEGGEAMAREQVLALAAMAEPAVAFSVGEDLRRLRSRLLPEFVDVMRGRGSSRAAIAALLRRKGSDDVEALLRLLETPAVIPDQEVRTLGALGATGDPLAIATLRQGLDQAGGAPGSSSLGFLIGLAASGDEDSIRALVDQPAGWQDSAPVSAAVVDALLHRLAAGERRAAEALDTLWDRVDRGTTRRRIAEGVLLGPASDVAEWLTARLREDVERSRDPLLSTIFHLHRRRAGAPDAVDDLVRVLTAGPAETTDEWHEARWMAARELFIF
jgi:hypothetical protein